MWGKKKKAQLAVEYQKLASEKRMRALNQRRKWGIIITFENQPPDIHGADAEDREIIVSFKLVKGCLVIETIPWDADSIGAVRTQYGYTLDKIVGWVEIDAYVEPVRHYGGMW